MLRIVWNDSSTISRDGVYAENRQERFQYISFHTVAGPSPPKRVAK
jgi:hypothetical protein